MPRSPQVVLFLIGPFLVIAGGRAVGWRHARLSAAGPVAEMDLCLVFGMDNFRESFALSLWLAVGSTALALVFGVPAAMGWRAIRCPARDFMRTIVFHAGDRARHHRWPRAAAPCSSIPLGLPG